MENGLWKNGGGIMDGNDDIIVGARKGIKEQ